MSNRLYFISLAGFLLIFLAGCQKEKKTERDYPQIRTLAVDKITSEGARFNAAIISGDAESITEHGFVWGRYDLLTINNSEKVSVEDAPELDQFSVNISSSLEAMKEYFVRSYLKVGDLVVYGDPVKFTSLGSLAPEITDFEPKSATWGDTVTIYGKNLTFQQNSVKVHFGTILATILKTSNEEITVKVPDQLTNISSVISIDILGNQSLANGNFTLLTYGSVESVFPATAKWGDTLVIKGFFPYNEHAIALRINNITTTILDLKENQITALFPPSNYAQSVEIQLGVDLHWLSTGVFITMIIPTIKSILPSSFGWEDTIVIKGSFNPILSSNQVLFDTKSAQILKVDNNSITCIVPLLNTHTPKLEVKSGSYVYLYAPPIDLKGPKITSVSPDIITTGGTITFNGRYFHPERTDLKLNGNRPYISSITTTKIVAILQGALDNGPVNVLVTVISKPRVYSNLLTVANPRISSVTPEYTFYDEIVTINGENFYPDDVRIRLCNTMDAEVTSASATEIKFKIPRQITCGLSGFTLITGGVTLEEYENPRITPPVINQVSPATGKPGDIITISGDFFNPDAERNSVYFDYNTIVTPTEGDRYHLLVKVPSLLQGSYNLEISTAGSGASAGSFQCNSPWTSFGQTFDVQMDQSTVVLNSTMYLLGGRGGQDGLYQVYNYANNQIETYNYGMFEMNGLFNCAAFIIGNNGYLGIGNNGSSIEYSTAFYKFTIGENVSTRLNDFPGTPRSGSFYFSLGSHGYIGTGSNNGDLLSDVWEYDSSNDTWTKKSDFPGGGSVGATAIVHDNTAYIIDGKDVWSYNTTTDQWTKKTSFPGDARVNGVGINAANGIYYGTGSGQFEINLNNIKCYQDFWYFSIPTNTWKKMVDFPMSRRSMYGYSYNGKIYIGGGYYMDDQHYYQTFYDIDEFDPNF